MTLADLAFILNLRSTRRTLPPLLLLTDDQRGPDPLTAIAALPRGSGVVFRSQALKSTQAEKARALARLCRRRGLVFLVAADWRLAATVRADGLHLPEKQARVGVLAPAKLWLQRGKLLTVAAHSPAALARAARLGANAALLSPVFPTESHPGGASIGPVRFSAWSRAAAVATYALGGVRQGNSRRLVDSGAIGVATVGGTIKTHK